ncbi:conjugative transposon protein TraM [Pedobacter petrophilus]|uniref:Conjugative transposon protein TraM n=1 Tax=Pedobacter petrophilus TaxID=1908241 RepID=A0A7K0FUK2_9SPHI|nr:conjugative transposon protein TraM [Pedobacter petrophilus]MRX74734.1 conjugative transposon protein TraM [Pedobacter petrophilus]
MKKIDVKKPRYALPIICLPFLLLFFYVYKSSFGKPGAMVLGRDSLQTNVARVSEQVKNQELSGKLDAFRNKFKQADGYTAVGSIGEEPKERAEISSSYNSREKQMLDSIDQVMKKRYGQAGSAENFSPKYSSIRQEQGYSRSPSRSEQDLALATALAKIKQGNKVNSETNNARDLADPMQLFRAQMALVDSMGKANDPAFIEKREKERLARKTENDAKDKKSISVKRAVGATAGFNTIVSGDEQRPIAAIIDQDITGFSGSRLRIRLVDDIMAGKFLIRKGTYLYATISGFSAQRVSLVISSVFYAGEILPVNLQIYDNDGLAGIYVPSSAFREFTRDMGSSSSQGISIQQMAENNNQLVMGVLSKMFQSTTTAVNKLIRSNKVKVKYNTQVYLIDPEELKRKQQSY